jgi:integrase
VVKPSFREAAGQVHAAYASGWRNPKHAEQWLNTLEQYVYPELGDRPVDQISTADILKVLGPIWLTKSETARRVRQRIAVIMDWAKASGLLTGENPVDGVARGLPRQRMIRKHHAALPYVEVSNFVRRLRHCDAGETVRLAFEFLILTAARTGEVVAARWIEMDIAGRVWTVPADRMKAQREHRVPLSDRAIAILESAKKLAGDSEFVFPGRSAKKPISNMAFLMTLRRMNQNVTAHGFRSAFRDWASEKTNFPREACEMALAHSIRDKTEAAYRRGDLFAKRQQLMQAWDRFCQPTTAAVVRFPLVG